MNVLGSRRAGLAAAVVVSVVFAASVVPGSGAVADSRPADPADPTTPVTVSADSLPTVQIDGVAWTQVVVGDTVFVGGRFTNARPAGAAVGANQVPRSNFLAYDIRTGELITTIAPVFNAQVRSLAVSPDRSRLYVGGDFTSVDGLRRDRLAAFELPSMRLVGTFLPPVGYHVHALAVSPDNATVFVGGNFNAVGSQVRNKTAAFRASDGGLLAWAPNVQGGMVSALVVSADGQKIVIGGRFTSVNGSNRPGYGLAALDATVGASLPWAANEVVRNAGNVAGITSLVSDGTNVYGTGFSGNIPQGNLEGVFAASWQDGRIVWIQDCHGDTHSAHPMGGAVYSVSHAHDCVNIGGFPVTNPWTYKMTLAVSRAATGTVRPNSVGRYANFGGQPAPSPLLWYPDIDFGTFTGQRQGPWHVTGDDRYLVLGGEFRNVNFQPQQGLVRFARTDLAPNREGPRLFGTTWAAPTATAVAATVRVAFTANWDRDNETLTYRIERDGRAVGLVTSKSSFYSRPALSFVDPAPPPGTTVAYRVVAVDPFGNETPSSTVSVLTNGTPTPNQAPAASFAVTTTDLVASLDAGASSDPDGTIVSYVWDFGDGSSATGATTTRAYAVPGTYTVRLTVADSGGATATTTRSVTVPKAPEVPGPFARDAFGRTVTSGLGTADTGGAWTVSGPPTAFSVGGGVGRLVLAAPAAGGAAVLPGSSTATDVRVQVASDKLVTGGSWFVAATARRVGTWEYRAKLRVLSNGAAQLFLVRTANGAETTLATFSVPGLTIAAGEPVVLRVQATGTTPTTVRAKVWKQADAEPTDWQVSVTDATADLQAGGVVGLWAYLSSAAANAPVTLSFDDFEASRIP